MVDPQAEKACDAVNEAADAIRRGDVHVGRNILVWILKKDPKCVPALLWYAYITEDWKAKVDCYSWILRIDPGNETAQKALDKYGYQAPPEAVEGAEPIAQSHEGHATTELEVVSSADTSKDPVADSLDIARRDLLDMSLRNKLLNYRALKTKGVEITDERPSEVYRILVTEGRPMTFLPLPEEGEDGTEHLRDARSTESELGQPDEPVEKVASRHTDDKLQAPYTSPILQSRLLSSYYAASTYIEEQGVNVLFMALGTLHWYESEASSDVRRAPLVLIPVELSRSSVKARFRVRYTEDDIVENLSLRSKLAGDFGLSLPEFPSDDGFDIDKYFQDASKVIEGHSRWDVDREAIALGFFSYGKFLMFNDLDPNVWPEELQPDEHPILRALLHDGFADDGDHLDDDLQIDDFVLPEDIHHVVDADSSQVLAIHDVNRGRNLVIQGPPGTGKSQTITNLIAEAIGSRKTVLFVSEKMAALEVVKRRLDQVGLGDACLELHSQKTKKKIVLEELKRSLNLGRPKGQEAVDIGELKRNQDKLNGYSRAVNEELADSGLTPYEVYGQIIQVKKSLAGKELPDLAVDDIEQWGGERIQRSIALTGDLQLFLQKMGRPIDHPFWGSDIPVVLPEEKRRIETRLSKAAPALEQLGARAAEASRHLLLPVAGSIAETRAQIDVAEYLLTTPDLGGVRVKSQEWTSDSDRLQSALNVGRRITRFTEEYGPYLKKEAWRTDVLELRRLIAHYGKRWWRGLSRSHRAAQRQLADLVPGQLPKSSDRQLELLDAIIERTRLLPELVGFEQEGSSLYGERWAGVNSKWDDLLEISSWLNEFHESVRSGTVPAETVEFVASDPDTRELQQLVESLSTSLEHYEIAIQDVVEALRLDEAKKFGKGNLLVDLSFPRQEAVLRNWESELARLQEVVTFKGLAQQLHEESLGSVVDVSTWWPEAREHLVDILQHTWLSSLLQRAMLERPALAKFDGEIHERSMQRFCELDVKLLNHNRIRLAYEHWKDLPKHRAAGQLGVLYYEFGKRRRHKPLRKLMVEAGNVIQVVKPVFMMSPLSIAMFLPPGSLGFDLVIFDEASQVKPVDAFGAILRGRQLVIVGDDEQLPPTTFFESFIDVDQDYSDSVTANLESILGLCVARGIPHRMLRWHYRSQHESLITVSNHEFYHHKLVIFPSPDKDKREVGLVFHYLPDTVYDRGGSRKNVEEAREVALAVMKHARATPDLTLGVATFSMSQQEAIRDQLEILRRQDSSLEDFFRARPEEPFFVKNLENVQGDERDVIFISVGYGKMADRRVAMNFGPLNHDGGERRLNVLITRARRRCEVFTNLKADDIDLRRTRARGVEVLKLFLKYAESGDLDLPVLTDREVTSPFELAVAAELRKLGHRVEHQVGTGGFFIDLAIVDPELPGRYLLGIECDGATYHSARSARDRDRIRQEVLETRGWEIHRIWSTDWFRNPSREIQRLQESIATASRVSSPRKTMAERDGSNRENSSTEIERERPKPRVTPPIKIEPYKLAKIRNEGYGNRLHEVSDGRMAKLIAEVVNIEGPVHEDEVPRRIVTSQGLKRLGTRIRGKYESGLRFALRKSLVKRKGEFLWRAKRQTVRLRSRSSLPNASRRLELIPPQEIELAIGQVIKSSYGMGQDEIPVEVARLFGFQRVTDRMRSIIESVMRKMSRGKKIIKRGGYYALSE